MSEPTIIDTALSAAAGTVVKDLEPQALTAFDDLKAFVHEKADRLRTALPALEQTAVDHIRSVASAVLGEYDNVLARIEAHLGASSTPPGPSEPVATPVEQASTPAAQPDGPAVGAPDGSVQVPAESVTGMATPAGDGTTATDTTQAV